MWDNNLLPVIGLENMADSLSQQIQQVEGKLLKMLI